MCLEYGLGMRLDMFGVLPIHFDSAYGITLL